MVIGCLQAKLSIPEAYNLKDKRAILRSLKDRMMNKMNVSVAEVDHQDLWKSAVLAVVTVAAERSVVDQRLDAELPHLRPLHLRRTIRDDGEREPLAQPQECVARPLDPLELVDEHAVVLGADRLSGLGLRIDAERGKERRHPADDDGVRVDPLAQGELGAHGVDVGHELSRDGQRGANSNLGDGVGVDERVVEVERDQRDPALLDEFRRADSTASGHASCPLARRITGLLRITGRITG